MVLKEETGRGAEETDFSAVVVSFAAPTLICCSCDFYLRRAIALILLRGDVCNKSGDRGCRHGFLHRKSLEHGPS